MQTQIPVGQYTALLHARGLQVFDQKDKILSFSNSIDMRTNLKYKQNFDLTPLDIATLIDRIGVQKNDVRGAYRVPVMELTIYWIILEFGGQLEGLGEVM